MINNQTLWELNKKHPRLTLAYQGRRLYCEEFKFSLSQTGVLWLEGPFTEKKLASLIQAKRVVFLLTAPDYSGLTGNALVQISTDTDTNNRPPGRVKIGLIPYRLATLSGEESYILRFEGWVQESDYMPNQNSLRFWLRAARSKSLVLSGFSVLIGNLFALLAGEFDIYLFLLTLCGGVLAHLTANFFSDYHDYINAVDSPQALSSITGALAREEVEPTRILTAGFITLALALILTSVITAVRGLYPLLFVLTGLFAAVTYGWKPIAYKYRGWGETVVGVMMGPLMTMGSYYIQTNRFSWPVFFISLSLGMIIFSVSLVNNLRDIPEDLRAGLTTLPMKLGVYRTKLLYYCLIFLPLALTAIISLFHPPLLILLITFFSLPPAWKAASSLAKTKNSLTDVRRKSSLLDYPMNSIRYYLSYALWTSIGLLFTCLF